MSSRFHTWQWNEDRALYGSTLKQFLVRKLGHESHLNMGYFHCFTIQAEAEVVPCSSSAKVKLDFKSWVEVKVKLSK